MFQIKICGITNVDDAKAAVEVGADALGFNFYPKSPRFITQDTAANILDVVPKGIVKVGLFVNEDAEKVASFFDALQLDLIQLHGDEPPEYLTLLSNRPVMKAFRLTSAGLPPIEAYLRQVKVVIPSHVLLDSHVEGSYGGSGVPADWVSCAEFSRNRNHPTLVLAGGLNADNVAQAIEQVWPAAVDTASGVESSPGRKDREKMIAFVKNARAAFLSKDG